MSTITLDEFLAADPHELALRFKKKPPVVEPPKAEVIPYPQGPALALAKAERTRTGEISRAIARKARADKAELTARRARLDRL
jgi:hypothetical protein